MSPASAEWFVSFELLALFYFEVNCKVSRKKHKKNRESEQAAIHAGISLPEEPLELRSSEISPLGLLAAGGLVMLSLCWAYWPTLLETFAAWVKEPDYSHGFLVAPLAAFFL